MGHTVARRLFMDTRPESGLRPRFILRFVQSRFVETYSRGQVRCCNLPHGLSQHHFLDCPTSSEVLEGGLPLWHRRRFADSSGRPCLEDQSEEGSMAWTLPLRRQRDGSFWEW